MKRLSQTLLLAGLLLQVSSVEAQPKGADPYLTAAAVGKIPPLPETAAIRPTGRTREFTLDIRPGSWAPVKGIKASAITITYDIAFVANNPGAWVFHCHEFHHTMNGSTQPGGLIQVIRYDGSASVPAAPKAAPAPAKPSSGASHGKGH